MSKPYILKCNRCELLFSSDVRTEGSGCVCGGRFFKRESPSNVPQGQANDRERSAYVQLADVRAIVKKMFKVDTDDFGMTEARRLQKAEIVGFNKGIDAVLKKLSEHFG